MITIAAPAKINLTLEVIGERPDGFHEVRSVIQAINLCDHLTFQKGDNLEIKSCSAGWNAKESLATKAANLLRETAGSPPGGLITVEKHIPLVSGLGGDSSDAAAVLKGLDRLWELSLPPDKMHGIARLLGSDVPFFLQSGTALAEGRGDIVTPLPPLTGIWFVLLIPDIPRPGEKTKRLYTSLEPGDYSGGQITRQAAAKLQESGEFPPELLCNTFERVAFTAFPGLDSFRERMAQCGAPHVHLAGSGPVLFTLFKRRPPAEELYRRLKEQKLACYLAEPFTSSRDFCI